MTLFEVDRYITKHFTEIMKAYEKEIKSMIEIGTVDKVMSLESQITFLNNYNPDEWEIDWISIKEKENDKESKKEE